MPFLPPNQQRQSTEGISTEGIALKGKRGDWMRERGGTRVMISVERGGHEKRRGTEKGRE